MLDRLLLLLQIGVASVILAAIAWLWIFAWSKCDAILEERRHTKVMNAIYEDHQQAEAALVWAQVNARAPTVQPVDTSIRDTLWRTRLELFYKAGNHLGFTHDALCKTVLSHRNWSWLTAYLQECGVLKIELAGTRWADGYDLARALLELRAGDTPLPDIEPFDVMWNGNG